MDAQTMVSALALAAVVGAYPSVPKTIGAAAPNVLFSSVNETILLEHTIANPAVNHGVISHIWSTACGWNGGGGNYRNESGIAIYRFYLDGVLAVESSMRHLSMVHFDPLTSGSAKVPWSTELFGQTSDMDGFVSNIPMPFSKSVKVTAQLPAGVQPFYVYSILRGQELPRASPAFRLGAIDMPAGTRVQLQHYANPSLAHLDFITLAALKNGSGAILASGLALSSGPMGSNSFHYLEGCFHLLTPYTAPFPGHVLSTGMEDFYDSSFYFHAGLFQGPNAGVTAMCHATNAPGGTPSPVCEDGSASQFSAYRVHTDAPLWFNQGVQLLARNGDASGETPWGSGKCYNQNAPSSVEPTTDVTAWSWVYLLPTSR